MSSVDVPLVFEALDVETILTLECWELVVLADDGFGGIMFVSEERNLNQLVLGKFGWVLGMLSGKRVEGK